MKHIIYTIVIFFAFTSFSFPDYEECSVTAFYRASDIPYGTKALDNYDNIVEIETLLIPDKEIKAGRYKVSVKRIDSNLYQVGGTDLYIETSMCLELAIYDDAILNVVDYMGYKMGTLIFLE
ncbi:hypothetical protein [Dysgonomonas termitidis]|uniref:DUF3244 domain-containing protein n=1 Tax=Dysgonomonas termitidis TaxID=1516126 RepID=A0ABV9L1Y4_9BACT